MIVAVTGEIILRISLPLYGAEPRLCLALVVVRLLGILSLLIIVAVLNEAVELLEIEESVADPLRIVLLVDEVVRLNLPLLHLLLVILAHQLSQRAIELANVVREQLPVAKYLQKQLLLVLLANETTLDPHSLISNLLPTIVEYLFSPYPSELLLFEPLDLHVSFIEIELANLATVAVIFGPSSLK
jgi:hypothetical protein